MFPQRLRQLRIEKKISQTELGRRVHVSQQAIGQWESGATSPAPETVSALALIFDVSADYLLGNSEKKEPTTVSGDGQAEKLAAALRGIGIDVDNLTDADVSRIAKLAKAAFED